MRGILIVLCVLLLTFSGQAGAENMTLKGQMGSKIRYQLQEQITGSGNSSKLIMSFVVPQTFDSPTYRQEISDFDLRFNPEPKEQKRKTDSRGNDIITATWLNPPNAIDVKLSCTVSNDTKLPSLETKAPFPLKPFSPDLNVYLIATEQVQTDHPKIRELSAKLTRDAKTEFDAIQQVLSFVVDHVRYVSPPAQYDAIYSLEAQKGNCQNFSHLTAAILRAAGIPVRIINGITLNNPYNIALQKGGVLTFKMGQGRHSWIEVWFPDLGWVPFDPQNSALFVSNRFVRLEVGVDNNETKNDGLLRWAQPQGAERPRLMEVVDAKFVSDSVKISGAKETYGPKNYLLLPLVKAQFKQIEVKPPPPPPIILDAERKKLRFDKPFDYGNIDFPENIDFAFPRSMKSSGKDQYELSKSFMVETAEYVTTNATQYAQVVVLRKPAKVSKIGLALHNFGGDGQLWVDIYQDSKGKPGKIIHSSAFINLDELSQKPGYRWAYFDFSKESPTLMPGHYWIALGFTGSPILNWFYTYGKPVGPVDGTRYKGIFEEDWSGALSYEFNYRVMGLTTK